MSRALARVPLAEQWADRICMQLGKSVESIIEVGRLLIKAKSDLAHGEWGRLFEEKLVPFNRQTAFKLIAIAGNPQLSDVSHGKHLPPMWTTLYELTKLPEPTLKHALADGLITPDMPRKAVKALVPLEPREAQPIADKEDIVRFAYVDEAVMSVTHAIRNAVMRWPSGESIAPLVEKLRIEADALETES